METLAPATKQLISLPRPAKRRRLLDPGEAPPILKLPDAMRQRLLPDSLCCPPHPGFIFGVCISCGKNVPTDGSGNGVGLLPFEYIQEGLKLSSDAVDALRRECGANLLERRRLVLVLDLDLTLLHTQIHDETDEMRVITAPPSEDLFEDSISTTKLRPYARYLLTALYAFYDMYIYTMGNRTYASKMAGLLDPEGRYFKHKVISREDSTEAGTKALDIVLAPSEAVVIVDDTESVWRRKTDKQRLINIKRYYYSGFTGAVVDNEEDEDLSLLYVFHALHTFHSDFFSSIDGHANSHGAGDEQEGIQGSETTNGRDVRKVMRSFQRDILCCCWIVIGDAFPAVEKEALGNIAKRLGATRLMELDQKKVTHIVAAHQETPEGKWAIANAKHLVSVGWLEEAYGTWTMPTESDFPPPPSTTV